MKNRVDGNSRLIISGAGRVATRTTLAIALLIMLGAAITPLRAQSNVTAGLQGYVYTDNNQTPAVNAKVRIVSNETQVPIGTAVTNEQGYFVRPDIPPGSYNITISLPPDFEDKTIIYEKASLGMFNDFIPPQILQRRATAVNTNPNPVSTSTPAPVNTAELKGIQLEHSAELRLATRRSVHCRSAARP